MQTYDYLIIDTVNLAYMVFNSPGDKRSTKEVETFKNKKVYPNFIASFIETINFLEAKFQSKEVIFLFDNYSSREELRDALKPLPPNSNRRKVNPNYKANRKSAKLEFYNSLDLIRIYYWKKEAKYHTARIPNLEADDLVKSCIDHLGPNASILLVTNDSDWTKYLSDKISYLPEWREDPHTSEDFEDQYGFPPSEGSITLMKILNGDSSDNIDAVFPEFKKEVKEYIIHNYSSVHEFLYGAHKDEKLIPFLSLIKSKERDIQIAYQLISAIPIDPSHFQAIYYHGQDSKDVVRIYENFIFKPDLLEVEEEPEEDSIGFEFGGISTPRRTPRA